jgi:hypothetical protein
MPAALVLTSGDVLLVGEDSEDARKRLSTTSRDASGFVTLTGSGGKDVHIRPEHVTVVRDLADGEAFAG